MLRIQVIRLYKTTNVDQTTTILLILSLINCIINYSVILVTDPYNIPVKKPLECRLVECLITENNITELKATRI